MKMFLVIKGNAAQAEAEARRRGIELEVDAISNNGREVYAYAAMIHRPRIIEWYCEDRGIAKVAQPGECLWYSQREDV